MSIFLEKKRQLGGSSSVLLAQANGIRNLRALVAAQSGDTHLRHDLPWKKTKIISLPRSPRHPGTHMSSSHDHSQLRVFFVSLFTREPKQKLVAISQFLPLFPRLNFRIFYLKQAPFAGGCFRIPKLLELFGSLTRHRQKFTQIYHLDSNFCAF